jgi:hypothetical protein
LADFEILNIVHIYHGKIITVDENVKATVFLQASKLNAVEQDFSSLLQMVPDWII